MRDQGRLVEWFDEQGYGFIQPIDHSKDKVFLHIKDFSRQGPRPIVGCALEYAVAVDGKGRYRANQVSYLKADQARASEVKMRQAKISTTATQPSSKSGLAPMQILITLYILAVSGLVLFKLLPGLSLVYLFLINLICYWCYAQDKEAAKLNKRRLSEQSLHLCSFLGGWPAAWLAQQRLRHKTQKQSFLKIYRLTILFNILLLLWIVSPFNLL